MLVAVSVLSVVINEMQGNGRLESTLKALGQQKFGGSFREVYWLPSQKLAASERVGSWCRYSISYACRGIGIVGSYHRNVGQRGEWGKREGSWTVEIWWILSSSILAAGAEACCI